MPKHQLLRHVKAKSLSVKIPKNEPNTARLSWVLANEVFLTVEIPRYALERFMVQAKRAIEETPLTSRGHSSGQRSCWKRGNTAAGSIWRAIAAGSSRCSAARW